MNANEHDETRLARLLAATHAPADPSVLARARARIAAGASVPRALAWLGTPVALAGSCALLVLATGLSIAALRAEGGGARETAYVSALIGDDGSYGLPSGSAQASRPAPDAGAADSDGVSM